MNLQRITLIQMQPLPCFGVLALTDALEAAGRTVTVLIAPLERDMLGAIARTRADLIGLSIMSTERWWALRLAPALKRAFPRTPLVLGGVHAILYPDDAIAIPGVDYICTSEGEIALLSLLRCLESGNHEARGVRGIWHRCGGDVVRNPVEILTQDIACGGARERVYYHRYPALRTDAIKFFAGSRGCPFDCAFCFNRRMREIFTDSGPYLRYKEPAALLAEVARECAAGPVQFVCFSDDLFTMNRAWLEEFTGMYRQQVGIPYMCQIRGEFADRDIFGCLAASGCRRIMVGVETGSEELRRRVLGKDTTNAALLELARLARQYGLQIQTFNMFGIPTETLADSFATVELNIRLRPEVAAAAMCVPFPQTELAAVAIAHGYLPPGYSCAEVPRSFHRKSVLRMPDIDKQERLHKLFSFAVHHPRLLPWLKKIIASDAPAIKLFMTVFGYLLFLVSFTGRYRGERMSLGSMLAFLYRFRQSY